MSYDLSCVITGHREAHISVPSLRSFEIAIDRAVRAGVSVQSIFCLDNACEVTSALFRHAAKGRDLICEVSCGDQGLARNAAVESAEGRFIAFLDADDLWAETWLVDALDFLKQHGDKDRIVAHPAFNYFFEGQASIFCHQDQRSPNFNLDLLRVSNYWDALNVCETSIYRDFPFLPRSLENGWAFEDWHWNCETIAAGIKHLVVPDTIIFKRRQRISQTVRASDSMARIRPHPLSRYSCPLYTDDNP